MIQLLGHAPPLFMHTYISTTWNVPCCCISLERTEHVCRSHSSLNFLPASLHASCLPWVHRLVRQWYYLSPWPILSFSYIQRVCFAMLNKLWLNDKYVSSYQNTYAPTCRCLPIHGPLLEDAPETGHSGHPGMQGQGGWGRDWVSGWAEPTSHCKPLCTVCISKTRHMYYF